MVQQVTDLKGGLLVRPRLRSTWGLRMRSYLKSLTSGSVKQPSCTMAPLVPRTYGLTLPGQCFLQTVQYRPKASPRGLAASQLVVEPSRNVKTQRFCHPSLFFSHLQRLQFARAFATSGSPASKSHDDIQQPLISNIKKRCQTSDPVTFPCFRIQSRVCSASPGCGNPDSPRVRVA